MDETKDPLNHQPVSDVITDHKELRHFEMRHHNHLLYVEYEVREGKLFLTQTHVPSDKEEAQTLLIENVLKHVENTSGLKVVPWSKAVANHIRKNPEWKRILSTGIRL